MTSTRDPLPDAVKTTRINDNERKVLTALVSAYSDYEEFCFLSFSGVAARCELKDRAMIRRAARSLTRKGLARFGNGLWNDDGEMAGAGYCATTAGVALHERMVG